MSEAEEGRPEAEEESSPEEVAAPRDPAGEGGSGVGGPGVAEEVPKPESGVYVPLGEEGGSSATPSSRSAGIDSATPSGASQSDSAAARSYEQIRAAKLGQAAPDGGSQRIEREDDSLSVTQLLRQGASVKDGIDNSGVLTSGNYSPAFMQEVTIVSGTRQVRVLEGMYSADQLNRMRHPYVQVSDFERICQTLDREKLIVLHGQPGTGRRATAVNAMSMLGVAKIGILDIGNDVALRDIYSDKLFKESHGYLLYLTEPIQRNTLETFAALTRRQQAHVVILAPVALPGAERLSPFAFEHRPASALEVLSAHCLEALRYHDCDQACTEESNLRYSDDRMADIRAMGDFTLHTQRHALVELAQILASNVHSGVPTETLVKRDRGKLREIAVQALDSQGSDGTVAISRRQGFLIAYAVFNGYPLSDVFETGELLSRQILPMFETRETPPDHVLFDGKLTDLLRHEMHVELTTEANGGSVDLPRRAALVDPALTNLFLDVAWNDFDAIRVPLLTWLDVLVGLGRGRVQVRAALAAGLLATFDFDEVYRLLFTRWARGPATYRHSVVLALELVALDGPLTMRVRRQVRDWAASANPRLQDSAALAYGSYIGRSLPEDAVQALRKLASVPDLAMSRSVAVSMFLLFQDNSELVLRELAAWSGEAHPHQRRHAARVLVLLSRAMGQPGTDTVSLSKVVSGIEALRPTLARMWADALIGPETARGAWDPLRRWILAADTDPELEEIVIGLTSEIFAKSDERQIFHLVRWCFQHPDSQVLKKIHDAVVPAGYRRHLN